MSWRSLLSSLLTIFAASGCGQPPPAPVSGLATTQSGYAFQSADTRALQDDDFANPGMLWVDQGAKLWATAPDAGNQACAGCHGDGSESMAGVGSRYPAYDKQANTVINLEGRINACRSRQQAQPPLPYESNELLALTAYVGHQSRGMPVAVDIEGPARPHFDAGEAYFHQRRGQMNLACGHCHDRNVGRMLRGDKLSQGQPVGYPIYRLEWQNLGSLQRRLRFCNTGVRAEPLPFGAQAYVDLELYLKWRARGLVGETPAVRR